MGLVYLTGTSGVGKTTVGAELRRRGFTVYDVDADGLARWFENASGAEVSLPSERGDAWYAENTYRLPVDTVRRLATRAGTTFICGTVGNDNEIWDLFDKVIHLTVDTPTLERRLLRRGTFGSSPDELRRVLAWSTQADVDNARYGAHLIPATGSPEQIAAEILEALGDP